MEEHNHSSAQQPNWDMINTAINCFSGQYRPVYTKIFISFNYLFTKSKTLEWTLKRPASSVKTQYDSSYRAGADETLLNVKSQKTKKNQTGPPTPTIQSSEKKRLSVYKSFHQDNNRGKSGHKILGVTFYRTLLPLQEHFRPFDSNFATTA